MAAAVKEKNEGRAWVPNVIRIRSNLWEQDIRICGGVHRERARLYCTGPEQKVLILQYGGVRP